MASSNDIYSKLSTFVDPADMHNHVAELAQLKHADYGLFMKLWAQLKLEKQVEAMPALLREIDKRLKAAEVKARTGKVKQEEGEFEYNDKGAIIPNRYNTLLALEREGITARYDEFNTVVSVTGLPDRYSVNLDDNGNNRLWILCEEKYGFRPNITHFTAWVADAAFQNSFHPVRDWLDTLEWDGVPRLDGWLTAYMNIEDTEFSRAVGNIVLTAGVRRVRQPGVKFDELLILEGAQGVGKSTAIRILARREEWFSDSVRLNVSEKEMLEELGGVWVGEVGELQGLRKGEVETLKAQLSRQTDKARMAYARLSTRAPRQCIFIGTTNNGKAAPYLMDATGNRRFWPVEVVGAIDLEALQRDVDQLWAEACVREDEGVSIHLPPELWSIAAAEQAKREQDNAFTDALWPLLGDKEGWVESLHVWDALGIPLTQRNNQKTVFGQAMDGMGWERARKRMAGGDQVAIYVKGSQPGRRIVAVPDGIDSRSMTLKYAEDVREEIDDAVRRLEQDEG